VVITAPQEFAGLRYSDVVNTRVNWTEEFRQEVQMDSNYGMHEGTCYILGGMSENVPYLTGFPNYQEEYKPDDECLLK
jgi:hypothetical protein